MKKSDNTMDFELGLDPGNPKDQAFLWISRLATGESDEAMLAEFERWRDSDGRNQKALVEARRLWLLLGAPLEERYAPAMASVPARSRVVGSVPHWRPFVATAAAMLLAVGLGHEWSTAWRYDQVSGTGEQRAIALGDGSTMWLNTNSAADVQVSTSGRHVNLARGEAYFDVARDPQRPFTVDAGIGQVHVLGTAFSVYRDRNEVIVTVQSGKVQVSGGSATPMQLTDNQRVRIRTGGATHRIEFVNAEQALSWRAGRLQFENRPVGEVFEELKRYDRRLVVVQYPDADRLPVSSIVDLARIDEWYDSLGQSLPVKVTRFGPFVWIRESAETATPIEADGHG